MQGRRCARVRPKLSFCSSAQLRAASPPPRRRTRTARRRCSLRASAAGRLRAGLWRARLPPPSDRERRGWPQRAQGRPLAACSPPRRGGQPGPCAKAPIRAAGRRAGARRRAGTNGLSHLKARLLQRHQPSGAALPRLVHLAVGALTYLLQLLIGRVDAGSTRAVHRGAHTSLRRRTC